jgi:hypothetical protein
MRRARTSLGKFSRINDPTDIGPAAPAAGLAATLLDVVSVVWLEYADGDRTARHPLKDRIRRVISSDAAHDAPSAATKAQRSKPRHGSAAKSASRRFRLTTMMQ